MSDELGLSIFPLDLNENLHELKLVEDKFFAILATFRGIRRYSEGRPIVMSLGTGRIPNILSVGDVPNLALTSIFAFASTVS